MNKVMVIGRLTADPEVKTTTGNNDMCRFNVAVDRGKNKDGEDMGADFIPCVAFGKTCGLLEKYFSKGKPIGIEGRIRTGSYEKEGKKIYTTDVVVDRIEFLPGEKKTEKKDEAEPYVTKEDYMAIDDSDIPF